MKKTLIKDGSFLGDPIHCPCCFQIIDLEKVATFVEVNEKNMGTECVYHFDDTEYECKNCGSVFVIKGTITEYPVGAFTRDLEIRKK